MLKAGIFFDLENLSWTGGRGCRYGVIRKLVEAQRAMILRANTTSRSTSRARKPTRCAARGRRSTASRCDATASTWF
jgi:hypothetical protein